MGLDTADARAELDAFRPVPQLSGTSARSDASKLAKDLKSVLTLQAKVICSEVCTAAEQISRATKQSNFTYPDNM